MLKKIDPCFTPGSQVSTWNISSARFLRTLTATLTILVCAALVGVPILGPPAAMASPPGDYGERGITLYEDSDFRGRSETFTDSVPSLRATSFGQDRASSIRIDRGCEVTLYSDTDYRGRSVLLTEAVSNLGNTEIGNDSASSFRMVCFNDNPWGGSDAGVVLYEDSDYGGRAEQFSDGDYSDLSRSTIGNDRATSIQVSPGCEATLFTDANFRGRSATLTNSTTRLSNTAVGNDSVSSLRVICFDDRPSFGSGGNESGNPGISGITLYSEPNFRGQSEAFYRDDPGLYNNNIGEDRTSSVEVADGCEATLFEFNDYGGRSITLRGSHRNLQETRMGNRVVSSIRVRCGNSSAPQDDYGFNKPAPAPGPSQGFGAILYSDANYRGREQAFSGDAPNLGDWEIGNDRATSIRVQRGCRAALYSDANYRGRVTIITTDRSNLEGTEVGNDSASSIKIDCSASGRRRP